MGDDWVARAGAGLAVSRVVNHAITHAASARAVILSGTFLSHVFNFRLTYIDCSGGLRMKRTIRIIGILVALLILIAAALPFLVNANAFRPRLESELTRALGRRVTVGDLKFSLFSGSLTANDLAVADDPTFSTSPFLHAKALSLKAELWPLISSRQLRITGLTIDT